MYILIPIIPSLISIWLCYFVYKKDSLVTDLSELKKIGLVGLGNILTFSLASSFSRQSAFVMAFALALYFWIFAQKAIETNQKNRFLTGYVLVLLLTLGIFEVLLSILGYGISNIYLFD